MASNKKNEKKEEREKEKSWTNGIGPLFHLRPIQGKEAESEQKIRE